MQFILAPHITSCRYYHYHAVLFFYYLKTTLLDSHIYDINIEYPQYDGMKKIFKILKQELCFVPTVL
jgi:hypothetical protein